MSQLCCTFPSLNSNIVIGYPQFKHDLYIFRDNLILNTYNFLYKIPLFYLLNQELPSSAKIVFGHQDTDHIVYTLYHTAISSFFLGH